MGPEAMMANATARKGTGSGGTNKEGRLGSWDQS